jgi:hypothetical protein
VIALGLANISVLPQPRRSEYWLPLRLFEATTPTAGAAWIRQGHIYPHLVYMDLIYIQPRKR